MSLQYDEHCRDARLVELLKDTFSSKQGPKMMSFSKTVFVAGNQRGEQHVFRIFWVLGFGVRRIFLGLWGKCTLP